MSIKERKFENIRKFLDIYQVQHITLCGELYALDAWAYRDADNKLQSTHEWCWIPNASAARKFVGY